MEILGKQINDRTEAIVNDITSKLVYPVEYRKMNVNSQEDLEHPVAMDNGQKKFLICIDNDLSDELFENALIRDLIYCQQMNDNVPILQAKSEQDLDARQVAMMISSVIMDIDMENKLKAYGMHLDDVDTMRLADLFDFLKAGMSEYNRPLYHNLTGLQVTLLLMTSSKPKNVEDIIQTFHLSDPEAMELIDKYVDIIDRYGVNDKRSMMRCMRKMAVASGMKGRMLLEYDGRVSEV